jgi:hypothetical protein
MGPEAEASEPENTMANDGTAKTAEASPPS